MIDGGAGEGRSANRMKTAGHFQALRKDILLYGMMSALTQMSGVLLLPILTRVLSVDEYGAVDIVATFVSLLAIGVMLALPSALVRYYRDVDSNEQRSLLASSVLFCVALVGLLVMSGLSFSTGWLAQKLLGDAEHGTFIWLGCWTAVLRALSAIPQMTLRMERRILAFTVPSLLSTALYVGLALFFVLELDSGVVGVFWAHVLAGFSLLLVSMVLARRHFAARVSIRQLRRALRFSLPLLPSNLSVWINRQIGRIVLLFVVGLAGVAVFGAAARIALVVGFLLTVFQKGWTPYAMIIIREGGRNEVYRRTFNYYAGGFACLALALTTASPELFSILVPADYRGGFIIIPWLLGGDVLHHSQAFVRLGMEIGERTSRISIASWTGMIINVLLALALVQTFGIAGAAIAFLVAEFVATGLMWRFSKKTSDVRFDTAPLVIVFLTYVVASTLFLVVTHFMTGALSLACRLAILAAALVVILSRTMDEAVWRSVRRWTKRARVVLGG